MKALLALLSSAYSLEYVFEQSGSHPQTPTPGCRFVLPKKIAPE